jgi:glycolate oxidase
LLTLYDTTLGIATAITLRLLPAPLSVAVLLADFTSMEAAAEAVRRITEEGLLPAGLEMMDSLCITAVNSYLGVEEYPPDAAAVLLVELDGLEAEVTVAIDLVDSLCRGAGARTVRRAREAEDRARLWQGRKSAISALGRRFPSYYLQDGVVPRGALPAVMRAIGELSERFGLPVANVFHAGDGNLHPLILYRADEPGVGERVQELGAEILRLCIEAGGSISGEHGIGNDKRCYMDWMFSPDDLATMTLVREAFDPASLANPGKLFPTPKTCAESARRRSEAPELAAVEVF